MILHPIIKRNWWLALIFLLLLVLLIFDLTSWLRYKEPHFIFPSDQRIKGFAASVALSKIIYDPSADTFSALLDLDVESTAPAGKGEIRRVSFSLQKEPSGETTEWYSYRSKRQADQSTEIRDPSGNWLSVRAGERLRRGILVDTIHLRKEVGLAVESVRPPFFYPFDVYTLRFIIRGCVDLPVVCRGRGNMHSRELLLKFTDRAFLVDCTQKNGGITCILKRKRFVRTISIVFLSLSLVFFGILLRVSESMELLPKALGFFAVLWGFRDLIVPDSVEIFPTIVDYVVLQIFVMLFGVIILRTVAHDRKEKNDGG